MLVTSRLYRVTLCKVNDGNHRLSGFTMSISDDTSLHEMTDQVTRPYKKRVRAAQEAETRRRIVDATIALHESQGGATTISDIAKRAGVSRPTVYRHFPDERSLVAACTSTYFEEHPPPDFRGWAAVVDPRDRLRRGLGELYTFYRENQGLLARADQEMPSNPALRHALSGYLDALAAMREVLMVDWATPDPKLLRAAVGHAIHFGTWHSLAVDQELSDERAADLMEAFVAEAARECLVMHGCGGS